VEGKRKLGRGRIPGVLGTKELAGSRAFVESKPLNPKTGKGNEHNRSKIEKKRGGEKSESNLPSREKMTAKMGSYGERRSGEKKRSRGVLTLPVNPHKGEGRGEIGSPSGQKSSSENP